MQHRLCALSLSIGEEEATGVEDRAGAGAGGRGWQRCRYFRFILVVGEPFIYPGIWQVLERCTERELVMCISTNGTLITPQRARRLKDYAPLYFQVSLDGGNSASPTIASGARASLSCALRGLEMLAAEDHSLTVNSVLTRL